MKLLNFIIISVLLFACSKDDDITPSNDDGDRVLNDTIVLNVEYGNHSRQKYDIHLPKNRDSTTSVILMIHGGAWKAGQKEEVNNYVNLIKANWENVAVVNMNYRLASNADNIHHDEIMDDIESVIGHVINNQSNYHISTDMGIMGVSAGGQLAMIYAYNYNHYGNINCVGSIFGPSNIKDWSWYNSFNPWLGGSVSTILSEYVGQSWDSTAYENVSPYWNITENSQPTILFHGNLDVIVPVYQSQWMHSKLNTLSVPNEYHEYIAGHGFDNTQSQDVISKLVDFFDSYIED